MPKMEEGQRRREKKEIFGLREPLLGPESNLAIEKFLEIHKDDPS